MQVRNSRNEVVLASKTLSNRRQAWVEKHYVLGKEISKKEKKKNKTLLSALVQAHHHGDLSTLAWHGVFTLVPQV